VAILVGGNLFACLYALFALGQNPICLQSSN
jgi:hypothetical protein